MFPSGSKLAEPFAVIVNGALPDKGETVNKANGFLLVDGITVSVSLSSAALVQPGSLPA